MANIMDDVTYLTQEIGPRPAGTEEEQRAALFLEESFQKAGGTDVAIEEFSGAHETKLIVPICFLLSFAAVLLQLFLPVAGVAAIIISLLALAVFVTEVLDKNLFSRFFSQGVSQNVVARYVPHVGSGSQRSRKVVICAHYDTGKVRRELAPALVGVLPLVQKVYSAAMLAAPIVLIIRVVLAPNAEGVAGIFTGLLSILVLVALAIPLLIEVSYMSSRYNEGANCNASATVALLELAGRVFSQRGSSPAADAAAEIHGSRAAYEQGLVPEGAELVYDEGLDAGAASAADGLPQDPMIVPETEEQRLAAAKAAIAALTGKPVPGAAPAQDISRNLVNLYGSAEARNNESQDGASAAQESQEAAAGTASAMSGPVLSMFAAGAAGAAGLAGAAATAAKATSNAADASASTTSVQASLQEEAQEAEESSGFSDAPSWFKRARQKAKKTDSGEDIVPARSKLGDALDAANAPAIAVEPEAEEEQEVEIQAEIAAEAQIEAQEEDVAKEARDNTEALSNIDALQVGALTGLAEQTSFQEETTLHAAGLTDTITQETDVVSPTIAMAPIDLPQFGGEVPQSAREASDAMLSSAGVISAQAGATDDSAAAPQTRARAGSATSRSIVLPDITASQLTPIAEIGKQRAPLAEAEVDGKAAARSLLSLIPDIASDAAPSAQAPFLEGASSPEGASAASAVASSIGASRSSLGATGNFDLSASDLFADAQSEEDIFVSDVDESQSINESSSSNPLTDTGYIEMPKSRISGFFGRIFGSGGKKEETSTREWLDVDDDFDAREVGAARGSWESFRNDDESGEQLSLNDEIEEADAADAGVNTAGAESDEPDAERTWNGGAFSADYDLAFNADENPQISDASTAQGDNEGLDVDEAMQALQADDDRESIRVFHGGAINTEVWFVALGAQLNTNSGMKNFMAQHSADLRGAVFIELEALGAGELCFAEKEGGLMPQAASSRMVRYIRKAASGAHIRGLDLSWRDSAAACALRAGHQALHLLGAEGNKPAFYAQANDTTDVVSEDLLQENIDCIMEMLKNI